MKCISEYNRWMSEPKLDKQLKEELLSIENYGDVEERFHKHLEFGTAGIRGILGAGTNRLNVYTVARISEGLAKVVVEHRGQDRGVVIGYDVRHFSREFAEVTAAVLANHGIKVYLFSKEIPTPLVSYAIRELKAISGVMITASHNPKEYNGYKVYWDDGTQITSKIAKSVASSIENVNLFDVEQRDFEGAYKNGEIEYVNEALIDKYINGVKDLSLRENVNKDIEIVYSPLNGTGKDLIKRVLYEQGYKNISLVKEQSHSDPDFTNTPHPNPENIEAFESAIKLGEKVNSDVLIATDPDADRIGVMVKHKDKYEFLNGNKLGAVISHYILKSLSEQEKLEDNSSIVKTIVTDNLVDKMAAKYNVKIHEVHVGFKNIYSLVNEWIENNENNYLFGYEESLGFGIGFDLARDKDAVSAAMFIVEMVAYYSTLGLTLVDVYNELQKEHGYHSENNFSMERTGIAGQAEIASIVQDFRDNPIKIINGSELIEKIDYLNDETGLESLNVLKYKYKDGTWFAIRPSGTEPKLKVYVYTSSNSKETSKERLDKVTFEIKRRIETHDYS